MSEPRFPTVHVVARADDADLLGSVLFELGATGVEERDESTFDKGPKSGHVLLIASFEERVAAEEAARDLATREGVASATLEEIVGDAWRDKWKEFYEPFALSPSIVIRPPWHDPPDGLRGATVLVLEPGRAFGTGLHATTSLVANILDEHASALRDSQVLDAGCGSGILSFVALALGAARVTAFDIDADVVDTVLENAERNAMTDRIDVRACSIDAIRGTFDWVVANIESKILVPIADDLASRVGPRGHLVLSGILTAEEESVRSRFTSLSRSFEVAGTKHMATGGARAYDKDGWVAIHLVARSQGVRGTLPRK